MRKKNKFVFVNANGVKILLWLVLTTINPNTVVSTHILCKKIQSAKLHKYNGNPKDLIKAIEHAYQGLIKLEKTMDDMEDYVIQVLMSGKNVEFNQFINKFKEDIKSSFGKFKDVLPGMTPLRQQRIYTPISKQGLIRTKLTPCDAQILAHLHQSWWSLKNYTWELLLQ